MGMYQNASNIRPRSSLNRSRLSNNMPNAYAAWQRHPPSSRNTSPVPPIPPSKNRPTSRPPSTRARASSISRKNAPRLTTAGWNTSNQDMRRPRLHNSMGGNGENQQGVPPRPRTAWQVFEEQIKDIADTPLFSNRFVDKVNK